MITKIEVSEIPRLIELLKSASDAVKEQAAATLRHLAANCPENQSAIREENGIALLIGNSEHLDMSAILTEQDITPEACDHINKLSVILTGLLFLKLIKKQKWDVLEKIGAQVTHETIARFNEWVGMDLNRYLRVNNHHPIPDKLLDIIHAKVSRAEIDSVIYSPHSLAVDEAHQNKLIEALNRDFSIRPGEIWRLFIDYDNQNDNNPNIFDKDEPGYLSGLINGFEKVRQMCQSSLPLSLSSIIALHDAAVVYRATNNQYGRVQKKNKKPFALGTGVSSNGKGGWHYCCEKLAACDEDAKKENRGLSTWLIEIFANNTKICGQFTCYQEISEKANRIINEYNNAIKTPGIDETGKLRAIAWLCKQLEMFHMFPDGNQRTISFLLLNMTLKQNGLDLCILPEPECFDGYYSVNALVEEIKVGQLLAQIHLHHNFSAHTALLHNISISNQELVVILRAIKALAAHSSLKTQLGALDIISRIIELCELSQEGINEHAVGALRYLAKNCEKNQSTIRDAKGIPVLINLLKSASTSNAVKLQVAAALRNLARDCSKNQSSIREENGIPVLIKLLQSAPDAIQKQAIGALKSLAENCLENKVAIREANGIPVLIGLLQSASTSNAVKLQAAATLKTLVIKCPKNKAAVREANGIPVLMRLAQSNIDLIKEAAAGALRHVTENCPESQSTSASNAVKEQAAGELMSCSQIGRSNSANDDNVPHKILGPTLSLIAEELVAPINLRAPCIYEASKKRLDFVQGDGKIIGPSLPPVGNFKHSAVADSRNGCIEPSSKNEEILEPITTCNEFNQDENIVDLVDDKVKGQTTIAVLKEAHSTAIFNVLEEGLMSPLDACAALDQNTEVNKVAYQKADEKTKYLILPSANQEMRLELGMADVSVNHHQLNKVTPPPPLAVFHPNKHNKNKTHEINFSQIPRLLNSVKPAIFGATSLNQVMNSKRLLTSKKTALLSTIGKTALQLAKTESCSLLFNTQIPDNPTYLSLVCLTPENRTTAFYISMSQLSKYSNIKEALNQLGTISEIRLRLLSTAQVNQLTTGESAPKAITRQTTDEPLPFTPMLPSVSNILPIPHSPSEETITNTTPHAQPTTIESLASSSHPNAVLLTAMENAINNCKDGFKSINLRRAQAQYAANPTSIHLTHFINIASTARKHWFSLFTAKYAYTASATAFYQSLQGDADEATAARNEICTAFNKPLDTLSAPPYAWWSQGHQAAFADMVQEPPISLERL